MMRLNAYYTDGYGVQCLSLDADDSAASEYRPAMLGVSHLEMYRALAMLPSGVGKLLQATFTPRRWPGWLDEARMSEPPYTCLAAACLSTGFIGQVADPSEPDAMVAALRAAVELEGAFRDYVLREAGSILAMAIGIFVTAIDAVVESRALGLKNAKANLNGGPNDVLPSPLWGR